MNNIIILKLQNKEFIEEQKYKYIYKQIELQIFFLCILLNIIIYIYVCRNLYINSECVNFTIERTNITTFITLR